MGPWRWTDTVDALYKAIREYEGLLPIRIQRKTLSGLVLLLDMLSIQLRIGLSPICWVFGKGDGNALPFYSLGLLC